MKRWTLLAACTALVAGCRDVPGPTAPPTHHRAIVDAARGGPDAHFYFLPPIVPAPSPQGTFDPDLYPVVEICQLAGPSCGPVVARFERSGPPRAGRLRVNRATERYVAAWRTRRAALDSGATYRITVLLGGVELGYADVDVVDRRDELRDVDRNHFVPLLNGRTLRIRFRLEEGAGPTRWSAVTAGAVHACGLSAAGKAYCWGWNAFGQLGDGTTTDAVHPVAVAGALTFEELRAGGQHTCGIAKDHRTYCWGWNQRGQVGDSSNTDRYVPTLVRSPHRLIELAAGGAHTCAIDELGNAYCWGENDFGRLGDGTQVDRNQPVPVLGGVRFQTVTAAVAGSHTCGLADHGDGYCWGENEHGRLGDGTTVDRMVPTAVASPTPLVDLEAGGGFSCALGSDEGIYCWGHNNVGQLGDGTTTNRVLPVRITTPAVLHALAPGGSHACGLSRAQDAFCWGWNAFGEVGDGSRDLRTSPVRVSTDEAFRGLSAGTGFTCGVAPGGAAYCWGHNGNGQLGVGSTQDHPVPVRVSEPRR